MIRDILAGLGAWFLASLIVAAFWWLLRTIDDAVTKRCASPEPSSGASTAASTSLHASRTPRPDPTLRPRPRGDRGLPTIIRWADGCGPHPLRHAAVNIDVTSADAAWDVLIRSDRSVA